MMTLAVAACSSGSTSSAVSAPRKEAIKSEAVDHECAAVFSNLAKILSATSEPTSQEEVLYYTALHSCKSLTQWSNAANQFPMAIGFKELTATQAAEYVYIDCFKHDPELLSPVCADAEQKHYLD